MDWGLGMKRHEFVGRLGAAIVGPGLAAMMMLGAAGDAHAQASQSNDDAKIIRCRENATELIWLDRAALRNRCGLWSYVITTKTKGVEREQIVYNRYFYVFLQNGVVTSVKKKRQIFTGFKNRN
jgi:hypothetical protein